MSTSEPTATPSETEREGERASSFVASPFRESHFEIIDGLLIQTEFLPLSVQVLENTLQRDPMFRSFDRESFGTAGSHWPSSGREREKLPAASDSEQHKAALAAQFQLGREEGYAAGMAEATQLVEQKQEEIKRKFDELRANLDQTVQDFFARTEREAVRLSLQVARKVLELTTHAKPEYIYDIIRTGLRSLGAAIPLKIKISEQDFEFIEVIGLPPDLTTTQTGIQYIPDASIKGGCVIETDFGNIDLQIDSMWEQVSGDLFEVSK